MIIAHEKTTPTDQPKTRGVSDLYAEIDAILERADDLGRLAVERRCGLADRAAHAAVAVVRAAGVEVSAGNYSSAGRLLNRAWNHVHESEGALNR